MFGITDLKGGVASEQGGLSKETLSIYLTGGIKCWNVASEI